MAELVEFFVEEMSNRVDTIRSAAESNDLAQLRVIAHQLKGAATGYGFAPISESAATLEKLIDTTGGEPANDAADLNEQIDALIALCNRAAA